MHLWRQQIKQIRLALADPHPIPWDELLVPHTKTGQIIRKMVPGLGVVPREAAALLLFYPEHDELWFPLTVRSSRLSHHRGEVALPGGAADPKDYSLVTTALREAKEEIGVPPCLVEVLGLLSSVYIPVSNFRVTPVVGFSALPPPLRPCPIEIAQILRVPFRAISDPANVVVEEWTLDNVQVYVPFFSLDGHKVWGATAMILSELLARVRRQEQVRSMLQ